jgi:hypothetical protein
MSESKQEIVDSIYNFLSSRIDDITAVDLRGLKKYIKQAIQEVYY